MVNTSQPWKDKLIALLRWSEKYTKTDMVYLTTGGFWLTLSRIVSSASSFFLAIAFANLLPKEAFGTYKYILSVVSILSIPTLPGMETAVTQSVARGFEGTLHTSFRAKIKWGFLGGVASLILAGYYYFIKDDAVLTISFLIAGVFFPFFEALGLYDAFLQGRKEFKYSSAYNIVIKIAVTVALVGILFLSQNLILIVLTYFVSYTALTLVFYIKTKTHFQPNNRQDLGAIVYGKHLSLMQILNTIASYFDRILVFHLLGATPLAVYSIAIAAPEQIKAFLGLLKNLLFPKFAEGDDERIVRGMKNKFTRLTIMGIAIIVMYIIIAPIIFKMFFPEYLNAVFYSQLFSLSLLNFGFFPAGTYLRAKRKIKEQYVSNITGAVFQIITMTLLVIWQGLLGLVIARILSRYFTSAISIYYYFKVTRERK